MKKLDWPFVIWTGILCMAIYITGILYISYSYTRNIKCMVIHTNGYQVSDHLTPKEARALVSITPELFGEEAFIQCREAGVSK